MSIVVAKDTSVRGRKDAKRLRVGEPGRRVPEVERGGPHLPLFRKRAAIYVDGFNLFHAIDDIQRPYLHWVDLKGIMNQIIPRSQVVKRVVWVTAFKPQGRTKNDRQLAYMNALMARGVVCQTGHFVMHVNGCNACGHRWTESTEKQSDVNLALALADDAHADRFDVAYLVTVDGDHAATARYLKSHFRGKRLVTVAPPGRMHNRHILDWADARATITTEHLENALLPALVKGRGRKVERPAAWLPPELPKQKRHLKLVVSQ